MKKKDAIKIFGKYGADLGRALGLTHKRISQLPDELEQAYVDRIVGAAIRLGRADYLPENLRPASSAEAMVSAIADIDKAYPLAPNLRPPRTDEETPGTPSPGKRGWTTAL